MTYAYVALEPSGKRKTGFIDAADRDAAIALVTRDGKFVVEIKEKSSQAAKSGQPGIKKRVPRNDLALFTRRLADLSAAGLPLDRVLQVISEQSESATLSVVADEALADVRSGMPVSDALAKHPNLFPQVYTMTLKSGEASGQFPQVSSRLADFQETEVTRRSTIMASLMYPIILAVVAILVVGVLMFYVVPLLTPVFKQGGMVLPWNTQLLITVTDFLTNDALYIFGTIAIVALLYRAWVKTESGAYARDKYLLRMPLVGQVIRKSAISRYARVLGTLVFGGVPILEALNLSGLTTGNRVFMDSSTQVSNDVRDGKPIAQAMRDAEGFPPVLTNMVAVGEETGDLSKMLGRVSDSLDFEVDNAVRRLTSAIEPIIIVSMAAFVGFVIISIILPIIDLQNHVK